LIKQEGGHDDTASNNRPDRANHRAWVYCRLSPIRD
jgi:hypothetical protein